MQPRLTPFLSVLLLALVAPVAACSEGPRAGPVPSRTVTATSPAGPVLAATAWPGPTTPTASPGLAGATAAPSWLGSRVLAIGPDGFGRRSRTPAELRPRRIVTKDLLPPPADGAFHARIASVPASVLERSTWSASCPVASGDLRYVTVGFRGFDGRAHTGELLVNATAARGLVRVFRILFAQAWPIEQMRITSKADLAAAPTGDGNVTAAFACRPVRGAKAWSQHAYGLAVDLDPFQNPYLDGATVLPELARAYTDRDRRWPGMIRPGSVPVRAFASIGWGWGGNYRSKKDWMHFSSTGG